MRPKVAFICIHNSCRSQMAEAVSKIIANKVYDAFSAGTDIAPAINQTAVELIKKRYDIDMRKTQRPKLLENIPEVDIVITMGCDVDCPWLPAKHREDWDLDDPTGKEVTEYQKVLNKIEDNIKKLVNRIQNHEIEV